MPACLQPYWGKIKASAGHLITFVPTEPGAKDQRGKWTAGAPEAADALERAVPDLETRILTLFEWYGSGVGPWSGFPSYESVAEAFLLEDPIDQLVAALIDHPLTARHLEGAARYFAGYCFTQKADERELIPQELKQRQLTHSLESTDEDKIGRARRTFGEWGLSQKRIMEAAWRTQRSTLERSSTASRSIGHPRSWRR
jgi:hypothetical protein